MHTFSRFKATFLVTVGVAVGLGLGMIAPPSTTVQAQTFGGRLPEPETAIEEEGSCLSQFGVFISSLLSFEEFKDYWDDFLFRNRCQQDDIFQLQDKVEELMAEVREEYTQHCSSPEIDKVQSEIRETKMELYFVRHSITFAEDSTYKKNHATYFETGAFDIYINNSLKSEMEALYVGKKDWLKSDQFGELYAEWVARYGERIEDYTECGDSPWQEVAEKWKELQESAKEFAEVFEEGGKAIFTPKESELVQEQAEDFQEFKEGLEKTAPASGIKGFLQKHTDFMINGLEPKKAYEKFLVDIGLQGGSSVSTKELFELVAAEDERVKDDMLKAELLGKYTALYSEVSADSTATLSNKIIELRKVVTETSTKPEILPELINWAVKICEKQQKLCNLFKKDE